MSARIRSILLLTILLAPLVVRSTPPLPLPYHQFEVSGEIERAGGGSKENYTVVLVSKAPAEYGDDEYHVLKGTGIRGLGDPIIVCLTDPAGAFFLRVVTQHAPDSIAAAVVFPDEPFAMGEPVAVSDLQPVEQTGYWVSPGEGYCSSSNVTTVVEGYVYSLRDQTVEIP